MKKNNLDQPARIAYSSPITIRNSYEMVEKCIIDNIEGDLVEMGVALGAQIMAFKYALMDFSSNKSIHAFDSFIGIPLAGPKDTVQPGLTYMPHDQNLSLEQRLVSSGVTSHALEHVKLNFNLMGATLDNVYFYEGWFQNTLPKYIDNIDKISVLRLDGDLYESTLVSLEYLYPKVSMGGVVIVDDYGLDGCRLAIEDYFSGYKYPDMILVDDHVYYFVKDVEVEKKTIIKSK